MFCWLFAALNSDLATVHGPNVGDTGSHALCKGRVARAFYHWHDRPRLLVPIKLEGEAPLPLLEMHERGYQVCVLISHLDYYRYWINSGMRPFFEYV